MTFNITLPTNVSVRTGQYLILDALGHFWKVEDRLTNGLGTIFQRNIDGTFSRVFY